MSDILGSEVPSEKDRVKRLRSLFPFISVFENLIKYGFTFIVRSYKIVKQIYELRK